MTPLADWVARLGASPQGLQPEAALQSLRKFGPNRVIEAPWAAWLPPLLKIAANPLVLLLLAASAVAAALGQVTEAAIITAIVAVSSTLDYLQSYRSSAAAQRLSRSVRTRVTVLRGGQPLEVPLEEVVPGEVAATASRPLFHEKTAPAHGGASPPEGSTR